MIHVPTVEEMFKVGLHFGHLRSVTHPRSRPFVWSIREGLCIINLEQTRTLLERALEVLKAAGREGKTVLFVGTKERARQVIREEAARAGMPSIVTRWIGGFLTNFEQQKKPMAHWRKLRERKAAGAEALRPSEERQLRRLSALFEGLENFERLPDLIFLVDPVTEAKTVTEARQVDIPTVAIVDTNGDPGLVTYPIPASDDSKEGVAMLVRLAADAILEGRGVKVSKSKKAARPRAKPKEKKEVRAKGEKKPQRVKKDVASGVTKLKAPARTTRKTKKVLTTSKKALKKREK